MAALRKLRKTFKSGFGHHGSESSVESHVDNPNLPHIDTSRTVTPHLVREGETTTLRVKVTGEPPPVVRWYIGPARVMPSVEYQVKQRSGGMYSLFILCATEELEDGVMVVATNIHGEDRKTIEVRLYKVLNKHQGNRRRLPHRHRSSEFIANQEGKAGFHRQRPLYKSFASFGQFETFIDDIEEEEEKAPEKKLTGSNFRYQYNQSSPNIHQPDCNGHVDVSSSTRDNSHTRTLPSFNERLRTSILSVRKSKYNSTDNLYVELATPHIQPVTMDFGGFGPHHSSGSDKDHPSSS